MGIRIQPKEIDVPSGDPFAYDLLGRREQVLILTDLIGNLEGPCSIAVDAAWGAGKTTFLRMWGRHLLDEGFPVVQFNAWETDFTGEPFVALASEVSDGLKLWQTDGVRPAVEKITKSTRTVARWLVPGAIRLATSMIPIAGGEIGQGASRLAAQLFDEYPEARRSVLEFRSDLQAMADALWEDNDQRPLVVLIDELDRCRPSYAIELLEMCKHIFSVDHAVFILAVNRSELAHSVRVLYGSQFDAEGYLLRFFDHEITLPTPDRHAFIEDILRSLGIDGTLAQADQQWRIDFAPSSTTMLVRFLAYSDLSLRTIGQTIHRLGLVLSSLPRLQFCNFRLLIVLTVLKAVDPALYRGFVEGDMTDDAIMSSLLDKPEFHDLKSDVIGELLEAVIIEARSDSNDVYQPSESMEPRAPLLWRHHRLVESRSGSGDARRSSNVLSLVDQLYRFRGSGGTSLGLDESFRRVELVSPDLRPN